MFKPLKVDSVEHGRRQKSRNFRSIPTRNKSGRKWRTVFVVGCYLRRCRVQRERGPQDSPLISPRNFTSPSDSCSLGVYIKKELITHKRCLIAQLDTFPISRVRSWVVVLYEGIMSEWCPCVLVYGESGAVYFTL